MEHVILNLGQLTYLRLGGFWMVNSIPNFFLFYGKKQSSIIHTKIWQPKKGVNKVKLVECWLANHESKHKCLLMMPLKKNGRKD